ncbi:hypothetical protein BGZ80_004439, partial [Entomortierella chlamydospora]
MSDLNNPSIHYTPNPSNPKIIIAGAGLGGLTLAILLEKASIDYEILERATALKPLGSATGLAPNLMPLLEQLGLLDELKKISLECMSGGIYKDSPNGESLDFLSKTDISALKEFSGYATVIMSRPDLHALLLSHVPSHKIILGSVSCLYHREVKMAYSSGLEGCLPKSDGEDMKVCHMSILGTTNSIDPSIVPLSKDGFSRCDTVLGYKNPHSSDAFKNSDWGSESSGSIQEDWRAFKLPLGPDNPYITIGDLINLTENDNVTKVMLEEKLYTTWHHGRTVLMGD